MYSTPGRPGSSFSNPSQPEWRLPSTQHQSSWPSGSVAPPPPPPASVSPPPSYHPSTYGHISGPSPVTSGSPAPGATGGSDTTSWGVRYNRQHHVQSPPPLPPRPTSALEHHQQPQQQPQQQHYYYATIQSPTAGSADAHKPLPTTPGYGAPSSPFQNQQQWATGASYAPQQAAVPLPPPPPPPPPPIPPDYQNQLAHTSTQAWLQPRPPSYSGFAPSQHFNAPSCSGTSTIPGASMSLPGTMSTPPPVSGQHSHLPERPLPQASASEQYPIPTLSTPTPNPLSAPAPPVPPKAGPNIFPSHASTMGPVTPSDWEHLAPTPGDFGDVEIFDPKKNHTVGSSAVPGIRPCNTSPSSNASALQPASTLPPPAQPAPPQSHIPQQHHTPGSSISLSTTLEIYDPPHPARVDSIGTEYSVISAAETSDSIDGVIEAWNRPISPQTKPTVQHGQETSSPGSESRPPVHGQSPAEIPERKEEFKVSRKGVGSGANTPAPSSAVGGSGARPDTASPQPKPQDLFEDLDPWSRSSLARYVAMLRKEEVADSDSERFKIFTAFMAKEAKLREILYNIESEPKIHKDAPSQSSPVAPNPTLSSPIESGLIPVQAEGDYFSVSTDAVGNVGDDRYSPGGRPILPRLETHNPSGLHRSASQPNAFKAKVDKNPLPSAGAPSSRSTSVPPSVNDKVYSPLATNPPQPIYTPFRYTEGPQRGSDNLAFNRPVYQAYSALRQASAESGRVMSNAPRAAAKNRSNTMTSSVAQNDFDETFVGLIREKSVAYRNKSSRRKSSPPPLPAFLRQGKTGGPIDELRSMVSLPLAKQSEDSWHVTIGKDLEKYTNDFDYIREAFTKWEAAVKLRHANTDKERMRRQEESEMHIDTLFNEKEIGYADINVLEEEFRQREARVQLDEERRELDDFVAEVYNPLDERLKGESSALQGHYDSALSRLDNESKIKDSVTGRYNLSHTMKIVNDIYHKLEIRYQKRLEIALDRERRRKKTERRPLVFMGDSAALKKLDGDFDEMERRNILEAAKERDHRANRLMDSFDNAIMLGLGENQSVLDEVTAKVDRIDSALLQSSGLAASDAEQLLKSVIDLVETLRQDSEAILRSFGVADTALNNADYSVSVAEARYSNAEPEAFHNLEDEKKKEDAKIQNDLRTKLESVRVGPAKIIAKINDLLESLGKAPVAEQDVSSEDVPAVHPVDVLLPGPRPPTTNAGRSKSDEDPERQERLRKALEDAKRRNAARNS